MMETFPAQYCSLLSRYLRSIKKKKNKQAKNGHFPGCLVPDGDIIIGNLAFDINLCYVRLTATGIFDQGVN